MASSLESRYTISFSAGTRGSGEANTGAVELTQGAVSLQQAQDCQIGHVNQAGHSGVLQAAVLLAARSPQLTDWVGYSVWHLVEAGPEADREG